MAPLPSIPNVLRVALNGFSGEATPLKWANILHALYTGTVPTSAIAAAVATAVLNAWSTHMAPEVPSPISLENVEVTDLTSPSSASGIANGPSFGTRGDDEIPANACYLVDYPIGTRYRGGHPRSYLLVGGNADFLDAAHWSTAFTAEAINHWAAFLNAWVGSSFSGCNVTQLGAVSYYDKALNPTPPYRRTTPIFYPITISAMIGQQQMASQRRRIGRHRV